MKKIIPKKLKVGDEIRVIAPSRSMAILNQETIEIAINTLENLGFKVTFGKNVNNVQYDDYICASIEERTSDLHDAFKDSNVKAILTVIGGYNVNQILDYIDYDIIKQNPKIICGFSDITALLDAIYAKTGLVTYYGPHFSTFGIKKENDYTIEYFKKLLMEDNTIDIEPSKNWSNDLWFLNQNNRKFIKNDGYDIVNEGISEGIIVGGNLGTLNLLQGTEYMPLEDNVILFIEDDGGADKNFYMDFDRNLISLTQAIGAKNIKGIVTGRAETNCQMDYEKWQMIFNTKKELKDIPIIINVDFGHTNPLITFPLGGYAKISTMNNEMKIQISEK